MEGGGKSEYKKGLWSEEEDKILMDYITLHGKGKWSRISKFTGLKRGGKSCRLRWINYLCPTVKRGDFSEEEEDLIIRLHNLLGNRWSLIAGRVPGRTDNQVKNHWNTRLSKRVGVEKKRKSKTTSSCKETREEEVQCKTLCSSNIPMSSTASYNYNDSQKLISEDQSSCDQNNNNNNFNYSTNEFGSHYNQSSFWVTSNTPNLMEFPYESPDFFWHDIIQL